MTMKSSYMTFASYCQCSALRIGDPNIGPYDIRASGYNNVGDVVYDNGKTPFDNTGVYFGETDHHIRCHYGTWIHCEISQNHVLYLYSPDTNYNFKINLSAIKGTDEYIIDAVSIHDDDSSYDLTGWIFLSSYQKVYYVGSGNYYHSGIQESINATSPIELPISNARDIAAGILGSFVLDGDSNIYKLGIYGHGLHVESNIPGYYIHKYTNPLAQYGKTVSRLMDPVSYIEIGLIANDGSYWCLDLNSGAVYQPMPQFNDIIKVELLLNNAQSYYYNNPDGDKPFAYVLKANGEMYIYRPDNKTNEPIITLINTDVKDMFSLHSGVIYTRNGHTWSTYITPPTIKTAYALPELNMSYNGDEPSPYEVSGEIYTIPINDTNFKEPSEYIYSQLYYNSLTRLRHKHHYSDTFTSNTENRSRNFYIKTTLSVSDTQISGQGIDSRVTRNVVNYVTEVKF